MSNERSKDLVVAFHELTDPTAEEIITEVENKWSTSKREDHPYTLSVFESQDEKYVGQPIKVLAIINSMSDPFPIMFMDPITVIRFTLEDLEGHHLKCFLVRKEKFGDLLKQCYDQHAFFVFKGSVVSAEYKIENKKYTDYLFYLVDIDIDITANDLVQLKPDPKNRITGIFKKHASIRGGIFKFIKSSLVKNLGIKGLDKAKELDKCIDFMIYQSFSQGMFEGDSMKLHSLVIGAPGLGKKLLMKIAEILNPRFEQSASQKITPAGLIGKVEYKAGKSISKPKLLPRASGGVLCIEDFHKLKKARAETIAIFSEVMENGSVHDSTSAATRHEAVTSIHLDMNRFSQVNPSKEYDSYSDIDIDLNVISRFDFIIDIPDDLSRQNEIALEMAKGAKVLETQRDFGEKPQWHRDLKVIVAYIRTNFRSVVITEEISNLIQAKLSAFIKANEKYASIHNLMQGMMTRLEKSIEKFVKAIASADLRATVTEEHVDKAFEFVEEKLKFLSTYELMDIPDFKNISGAANKKKRQQLIRNDFKGQKFTAKQVMEYLSKKYGIEVSDKTIRRDFEKLCKPARGKGLWLLR